MIRRSPCENYLKYLVLHPDGYTNDQIKTIIDQLQLDYVGEWYIEQLRATCVPPTPFYPNDKLHARSQRFLIRERIQGLFIQDDTVKMAFKVLERPKVKEFIEALVLAGVPDAVIIYSLRTQRSFSFTLAALERYKHYFWDIELLDGTEMKALIRLRVEDVGKNPNPAIAAQMTALNKAYWNDPRKVAADLPTSPLSALFTQIRLGIMPTQVDLSKVLAMGQVLGSMRAVEAMLNGGPDDGMRASTYMSTAKMASEMLESVVHPEDEFQKKIRKLVLRTDETPVPLLSEVSGGQHSVDMELRAEAPDGRVVESDGEGNDSGSVGDDDDSPGLQKGGRPKDVPG